MRGLEVRDADRPDDALVEQPGQPAPRIDVAVPARVGPVDEEEIEVLEAQLARAPDERLGTSRTPCHSALSFVVTKSSSRGTPLARSPLPTPVSLP